MDNDSLEGKLIIPTAWLRVTNNTPEQGYTALVNNKLSSLNQHEKIAILISGTAQQTREIINIADYTLTNPIFNLNLTEVDLTHANMSTYRATIVRLYLTNFAQLTSLVEPVTYHFDQWDVRNCLKNISSTMRKKRDVSPNSCIFQASGAGIYSLFVATDILVNLKNVMGVEHIGLKKDKSRYYLNVCLTNEPNKLGHMPELSYTYAIK